MSARPVPVFTARQAELNAASRTLLDRSRTRRKAGDVRGAMRAYAASLRVWGWMLDASTLSK